MNIVLFGATDLTLSIANYLHENNYNLSALITLKPSFDISYSQEKIINHRYVDLPAWAQARNIACYHYQSSAETLEDLRKHQADFAIVAGWYHMVPQSLRAAFARGCTGFHASLLPKLRGGAPLNWAILLGLKQTGVSFFELSSGVDDGLLYGQQAFNIDEDDHIGDLVVKCETATLDILATTLPKICTSDFKPYPQSGLPSYCGQRKPEDSLIDWQQPDMSILRLIRASAKPYAGAYSFCQDEKITLWQAALSDYEVCGIPGQIIVIDELPNIVCGNGAIKVLETDAMTVLQKSNHKKLHP